MGIKSYKAALMPILVLALLLAPLLALMGTAEAQGTYDNILLGAATAYNINQVGAPAWITYPKGSLPPIMVAQRVGTGGVVAAGIAPTCRDTRWNGTTNPYPYLDKLLDAAFKWMKPGATKVLWFQGYGVYNDTTQCSALVSALQDNLGYTVTGNAAIPITSSLLAPYDIVVIPQLQLGSNGGDPTLLPDADVQAIVGFVQGGGGCLILDGSDFQGHDFPNVQNKILLALGITMGFQDDQMSDDSPWGVATYQPIVDVNVNTDIGTAYQSASGSTKLGVYSVCTMAPMVPGVSVKVVPDYQAGLPGETIQYRVKVLNPYNPGAVDSTYNLTVTDNAGWSPTISPTSLLVHVGENNKEATLSITVPAGASLGTEDRLVVAAVKNDNADVKDNFVCVAHAGKGIEPVDDSYVSDQDNTANYGDLTHLNVGRYYQYWQYIYLKFDLLGEIPDGANITSARLYLFCYYPYGPAVVTTCSEVADDSWSELSIAWNNKPAPGAPLDTESVGIGSEDTPPSYSWNVTSFIKNQFAGDKLVSLVLTPPNTIGESNSRGFESKDWPYENRVHPVLSIDYTVENISPGVSVSISPSSKNGAPGAALTYTVTVTNNGSVADNYSLTKSDTQSWSPSLSSSALSVAAGASGTATLTVTIPSSAANGASDTVTVTATSQTDNTISGHDTCVANAVVVTGGVQVSISPTSKSGNTGATLDFTVTVTNTGSSSDTFDLTASDTKSWGPNLSITSPTLAAGGSRTGIRLSITIPSTASANDVSTITVTATSHTNSTITGDNTCTATCTGTTTHGTSILLYVGIAVVVIVIIAVVVIVVVR